MSDSNISLFNHVQRLNVTLTNLMASTLAIETLVGAGLPVKMHAYGDFFELAATCSGQVAALQEEVVRLFQGQETSK